MKIRPHKGGRGERMQIRLSSEVKSRLEHLAAHDEKTMADVIIRLINKEYEATIAYVDQLTDYGRDDPTEPDDSNP